MAKKKLYNGRKYGEQWVSKDNGSNFYIKKPFAEIKEVNVKESEQKCFKEHSEIIRV